MRIFFKRIKILELPLHLIYYILKKWLLINKLTFLKSFFPARLKKSP